MSSGSGHVTVVYFGDEAALRQKSLAAVADGAVVVERGNAVKDRDCLLRWKELVDHFFKTWLIPRWSRS